VKSTSSRNQILWIALALAGLAVAAFAGLLLSPTPRPLPAGLVQNVPLVRTLLGAFTLDREYATANFRVLYPSRIPGARADAAGLARDLERALVTIRAEGWFDTTWFVSQTAVLDAYAGTEGSAMPLTAELRVAPGLEEAHRAAVALHELIHVFQVRIIGPVFSASWRNALEAQAAWAEVEHHPDALGGPLPWPAQPLALTQHPWTWSDPYAFEFTAATDLLFPGALTAQLRRARPGSDPWTVLREALTSLGHDPAAAYTKVVLDLWQTQELALLRERGVYVSPAAIAARARPLPERLEPWTSWPLLVPEAGLTIEVAPPLLVAQGGELLGSGRRELAPGRPAAILNPSNQAGWVRVVR